MDVGLRKQENRGVCAVVLKMNNTISTQKRLNSVIYVHNAYFKKKKMFIMLDIFVKAV